MELPGTKLREARESKGLSVKDVAEATRIKVQIIENLEDDDYSRIAAPIYGKGFIKLYSEHLGLDPAPLISSYVAATSEGQMPRKPRKKPVAAATRPEGERPPARWGNRKKAEEAVTEELPVEEAAPEEPGASASAASPDGELALDFTGAAPEEETRRLFSGFDSGVAKEPEPQPEPEPEPEVAPEPEPPAVPEMSQATAAAISDLNVEEEEEDWREALERELQAVEPVSLPMDGSPSESSDSASGTAAGSAPAASAERNWLDQAKGLCGRVADELSPRNATEDPIRYASILVVLLIAVVFLISGASRILRPGKPGVPSGPVSPEVRLAIDAPAPYIGAEESR